MSGADAKFHALLDRVAAELGPRLSMIASAITADAMPGHDETGGTVASLTEAVMGATAGLCKIADSVGDVASAICDLANAIRETRGQP